MKKKILAALMAAVMLFTVLPLGTLDTAWAEERASATADSGSISGEELLDGYLYRLAGMDIRSYETGFSSSSMAASYSAKANLNAVEQTVYNTLKAEIEKIASGQRKDTNIKTTGVLGSQASADKVWHALMADLPYELYWHDKVIGINYTYTMAADKTPFKDVTFSFAVAQEFRGKDVTTTNIPNVPAAVQTARSVVAANASKSDYDKLQAYRQYICDQVSYNYAAARGEYTASYGNPWQLLWVFDGDTSTNVVCEGYAKSFKYLCDLTEESNGWTGDVETISVTGTMGTENHMWNIVRIGGGNYLVDVTNCDTGMKGYPQKLFLRGAVGDGISYTVENTVYIYDDVTRTGFAAADLKLSGTDYTPAATALTAPTVTLKADASTGQPVISWSKVSGAAQYEVYRSATGKANSFSIIRRTAALSFTDTSAAAGNTYYYVVRAMKGSGSSATYSKFSKAQQITYTVSSLAVPTMTLTSADSGQPVISWSKVNGAAQYEIYRSTDGVKFSIIRRTAALAYTDTSAAAGTTYYYKVRAMSGSMYSDFCAAQTIKYAITSLTAPTMTLTSGDSGQPVISWSKVSGAAQYEIFRSTDGSKFSIIRRTAALSYTDTSAAAGTTYYYQVRAINGDVKSDFCAAQSIQYAIGSLTAPTMTLTSAAGGQPVISWSKVNGAAQYEIFRSTDGSKFSIIRRTAALSYTDTSAAAGTTYYYQVRAINGDVKSDFCAAQSIQYAIGSLTAPTMTLTSAAGGQPVISWSKVNGAAQYEIFRSTDGSKFSIIRRTAALSFTDTSAAAGTTYYYQVRAINGSVKSDFCAPQSIQYAIASLAAPTMTLTSAANGQPVVSWSKVNGAAQYEVYRSTNGNNFSIVRRTAALSFTDTSAAAGTTYYYQVRAINGSVKSDFCPAQSIRCGTKSIKVGFITFLDENSTHDLNVINAAKQAIANLGLTEDDYILKTNVPETQRCYDVAVDLAESGCDIIFADSFGHEPYLLQAAFEYPDVQFCQFTGMRAHTEGLANYHNAFASIYEGRYLTGVAAGLKLNEMIAAGKFTADEAVVGYVGAFTYAEVISAYTSFFLGVRSVCPTATMEVAFTGSWYDEALEKESAQWLIERGCKLISQHSDSLGAPVACENAGVPNVSYNYSTKDAAPTTQIVSSRINWTPYFEYAIGAVMKGENIATDWTGTLATGSVVVEDLNTKVAAAGTAAVLADVRAKLESGALHVFDCDTFTVKGKKLTSYLADVDLDVDYTPDTQVVHDGYFAESEFRSAPYFDLEIDGIERLNVAF